MHESHGIRVLLLWELIKLSPLLNWIKNKIEKSDEIRKFHSGKFFGLLSHSHSLAWLLRCCCCVVWCGLPNWFWELLHSHIFIHLIFTGGACLNRHTRLRLKMHTTSDEQKKNANTKNEHTTIPSTRYDKICTNFESKSKKITIASWCSYDTSSISFYLFILLFFFSLFHFQCRGCHRRQN